MAKPFPPPLQSHPAERPVRSPLRPQLLRSAVTAKPARAKGKGAGEKSSNHNQQIGGACVKLKGSALAFQMDFQLTLNSHRNRSGASISCCEAAPPNPSPVGEPFSQSRAGLPLRSPWNEIPPASIYHRVSP